MLVVLRLWAAARRRLWAAAALFLFLVVPLGGSAAVYYVDSAGGNDGNPGISQSTAWQNIPGTNVPGVAALVPASGWTKIMAGDTVILKSGSSFAGRVVIDGDWYESGKKDAPVRIARDPSWGSGPVVIDCTGLTMGQKDAAFSVFCINYLEIDGAGGDGIVVADSSAIGFRAAGASETEKMVGLTMRDLKFSYNAGPGVVLHNQDSFLLEGVEVDGSGAAAGKGFSIGGQGHGCSNGTVRRCASYNNGAGSYYQEGGRGEGFRCANSTAITYEKCVAHDNGGRGFDAESVGWPISTIPDRIVYRNCIAYNNGAGFRCSLDDVPGDARFWYLNCISSHNGSGWTISKGPTAYLYNCVSAKNGDGLYLGTLDFSRRTVVTMKNTIIYASAAYAVHTDDFRTIRYAADYNLYDAGDGSGMLLSWRDSSGGLSRISDYEYGGRPGIADWRSDHGQDGHSRESGSGSFAAFVDPGKDDYRLLPTSDAKGAGLDLSGEWPSGVPKTDMSDRPRPDGAPWDMGAFQYSDR